MNYQSPKFELMLLMAQDVITTSNGGQGGDVGVGDGNEIIMPDVGGEDW